MSTRIDLLTPVGRLVLGSLYTGATTDLENRPLLYKTGQNAGQPRVNYWFHVAIPKGLEPHWNATEWGKKIWEVGVSGFPNGSYNSPVFAWKVVDGDSTIPNTQGNKPCDIEGYSGAWVMKFSGSFAPALYNENGTQALTEVNAVQLGDYVQVYCYVEDNKSTQQPGVYLNPSMVARSGYGTRIIAGADPKAVGFGTAPLPSGASATPLAVFTPVTPIAPVVPVTPPPAYPQILAPAIPENVRIITPKANGATYEQLIAAGWTDELLLQQGLML